MKQEAKQQAAALIRELGVSAAVERAGAEVQRASSPEEQMRWVNVLLAVMKQNEAEASARPVVVSYGGGLDSFCMLVEGVRRGERIDKVAFLDVTDPGGRDPGEWNATYRHIREVVMPFCREHGIPFAWIGTDCYPVRGARSLYAWMKERGQIPVAGPARICTVVAKVERFEAWLSDTYPGQDVDIWIGFEAGEEARAAKDPNAGSTKVKPRPNAARRHNRFPLMEWGLCRCRCAALVKKAGFPVPRKSACMMCPYGTKGDWQRLAKEQPGRFAQIHTLERDKPPTAKGRKLSIMGYRTIYDPRDKHLPTKERRVLSVKAPMLPEFVQGTYTPKKQACPVCGAAQRATKAMGSDYLPDDEVT